MTRNFKSFCDHLYAVFLLKGFLKLPKAKTFFYCQLIFLPPASVRNSRHVRQGIRHRDAVSRRGSKEQTDDDGYGQTRRCRVFDLRRVRCGFLFNPRRRCFLITHERTRRFIFVPSRERCVWVWRAPWIIVTLCARTHRTLQSPAMVGDNVLSKCLSKK